MHNRAMLDECQLLVHLPGGVDDYNMPEPDSYTAYGENLACSWKPTKVDELAPLSDVPAMDGVISFDRSVESDHEITIRSVDRLRLVKLHGDSLATAVLFDIVGLPKRDNFAIICPVRKVTDQ